MIKKSPHNYVVSKNNVLQIMRIYLTHNFVTVCLARLQCVFHSNSILLMYRNSCFGTVFDVKKLNASSILNISFIQIDV